MGREWDRKKKLEDLLSNKDLTAEQRLSYEAQLERMKGLLKLKAARYKINKLKKVVESSKKSLSAVDSIFVLLYVIFLLIHKMLSYIR